MQPTNNKAPNTRQIGL